MDLKNINSFNDLRKAQAYLRQESAICRREMGRELHYGRSRLQTYLLTRLGIPLGLIAGFKLFRSASASGATANAAEASQKASTESSTENDTAESSATWWNELLAVVMPMLIEFTQRWLHDQVRAYEAATTPEQAPSNSQNPE